jgi:hypothetical protein
VASIGPVLALLNGGDEHEANHGSSCESMCKKELPADAEATQALAGCMSGCSASHPSGPMGRKLKGHEGGHEGDHDESESDNPMVGVAAIRTVAATCPAHTHKDATPSVVNVDWRLGMTSAEQEVTVW